MRLPHFVTSDSDNDDSGRRALWQYGKTPLSSVLLKNDPLMNHGLRIWSTCSLAIMIKLGTLLNDPGHRTSPMGKPSHEGVGRANYPSRCWSLLTLWSFCHQKRPPIGEIWQNAGSFKILKCSNFRRRQADRGTCSITVNRGHKVWPTHHLSGFLVVLYSFNHCLQNSATVDKLTT